MYLKEQIEKYFERIKFDGNTEICFDNLARLQKGHLFNIPYETLDQMNGVPLSLKPEDMYNKMYSFDIKEW